jgi:hypothetical protein
MSASVEFLIGLLGQDAPIHVDWEDLEGAHGAVLRSCQEAGFLASDPLVHPVPSCPHCGEGVPYWLAGRHLCNRCQTGIDQRHLRCWLLDLGAFLGWLTSRLGLRGGVRPVEDRLWQLGTWGRGDETHECFYWRGGTLSDVGQARLAAYRNGVVLHRMPTPRDPEGGPICTRCVPLPSLLRHDGGLAVADLGLLLRAPAARVHFDPGSGRLWAGQRPLGEVPVGSREAFFLERLASEPDRYVSYADLKREVLRRSGGRDGRDEATFCHRLKSRLKKHFIPEIDRLLATANKGEGYLLRSWGEA